MGLKRWMRRIERAAQGEVESFELRDGSRYYYDPASWDREEGGIKSGDDEETLITKRTLKPRPLVTRYDPKVGKHIPIDPYEDRHLEDLSE